MRNVSSGNSHLKVYMQTCTHAYMHTCTYMWEVHRQRMCNVSCKVLLTNEAMEVFVEVLKVLCTGPPVIGILYLPDVGN